VAFQLHDFEQVTLFAEALDAEGNQAAATFTWSSSDDTIVSVRDTGDGTAVVTASPGTGGLGAATVTAMVTDTSDQDTHTGTWEVEVVAGDAVTVNITPGEVMPKDQPA
jgi:uncharacterized protein YjdB